MSPTQIKWRLVVKTAKTEAQSFKNRVGVAPTLRGLFYALVSKEVLPNTRSTYARLSRVLTKARKSQEFPWDLIKDESRKVLGGDEGNSLDDIISDAEDAPLRKTSNLLDEVKRLNWRHGYKVSRWEGQPERVIFCLEKEALADAVYSLTRDWGVEIHVMRGYGSANCLRRLADRVKELGEDAKVLLLLLTDFDPSGEDIVRYVKETLYNDFKVNCEAEKIAVTLPQIQAYRLPADPDTTAEREKMGRDSRFKNWEHGFFRVELDALMSIVPDDFKTILNEAVAKHFDRGIEKAVEEELLTIERELKTRFDDLSLKMGSVKVELERVIDELQADTRSNK